MRDLFCKSGFHQAESITSFGQNSYLLNKAMLVVSECYSLGWIGFILELTYIEVNFIQLFFQMCENYWLKGCCTLPSDFSWCSHANEDLVNINVILGKSWSCIFQKSWEVLVWKWSILKYRQVKKICLLYKKIPNSRVSFIHSVLTNGDKDPFLNTVLWIADHKLAYFVLVCCTSKRT